MKFLLDRLDAFFDRLYGWKYNPLYQSGVLTIFLLLIAITTGTYLVFFYKIAAPYESIQRIQNQTFLGHWIRSLHIYTANAAIVAALVHLTRMFVQRRLWGARALAWISGLILLGTLFFAGLTGLMMVNDVQGHVLLAEMARLLDLLPIFSEPISTAFSGPIALSRSFFFAILFIHISVPLGLAFLLWLHTSKLARPILLPSRPLMLGTFATLFILSLAFSAPLASQADPHLLVTRFPFNAFFTFWLPLSIHLAPSMTAAIWLASIIFLGAIPWIFKPAPEMRTPPSFVHEKSCTGCTSCYVDCPYDAIAMVPRSVGLGSQLVAHVNPARCVSCGICAAACDPMGVGPLGKTGRDQLKEMESLLKSRSNKDKTVLVAGCAKSIDWPISIKNNPRYVFYSVSCSGNLHTAVLELALKKGIMGVFVVSCLPRNCANREGPKWLEARLTGGHDAALNPQIDSALIQIAQLGPMEVFRAVKELNTFADDLANRPAVDLSQLDEKVCVKGP